MPANKQPVCIDAIRSTCNQSTVILIGINLKVLKFLREHNADLVDLVGQGSVQNLKQESVSRLQLVDVGKQLGGRQSPVS